MSTHPNRSMTFIAIHRSADTSLATTRWHLTADEASCCESAVELLERLQRINDARAAELQAATTSAREAGYAAGRDEALDTIAAGLVESWQRCADAARVQIEDLRHALVLLSRHIVQRIAASMAPAEVVTALALRAVQDLVPAQAVIVRVHPAVEAAVRSMLAATGERPLNAAIEVRADPGLGLTECELDTPRGRLIAGLDAQLDKVVRVLGEDTARPGESR